MLDDFGLTEHFPKEVPNARSDGGELEIRVFSGMKDALEDGPEAPPEEKARSKGESGEKEAFPESKVARLGQRGERNKHSERTNNT